MLWVRAAPREPWGNTRFGDSCPESRSVPQSPPFLPTGREHHAVHAALRQRDLAPGPASSRALLPPGPEPASLSTSPSSLPAATRRCGRHRDVPSPWAIPAFLGGPHAGAPRHWSVGMTGTGHASGLGEHPCTRSQRECCFRGSPVHSIPGSHGPHTATLPGSPSTGSSPNPKAPLSRN